MEINTKYFGRLPFPEKEAILFQEGLFGFDKLRKYALLPFENENDSLLSLQSLDDENIAFIIINPFAFLPNYAPCLSEKEIQEIGASDLSQVAFYNICVLNEDIEKSTVNLRCPIILNPKNHQAKQLILDDSDYPFKFPFSGFQKKGV